MMTKETRVHVPALKHAWPRPFAQSLVYLSTYLHFALGDIQYLRKQNFDLFRPPTYP